MGNVPFINIDKFQPALPMRGVTGFKASPLLANLFQPALPMRGVTGGNPVFVSTTINFNPHSPCGE